MKALKRFAFDAFYVVLFFSIGVAAAVAVHFVANFLESAHVDPTIVWIFRKLGILIASVDAIGVVCGSVFSLYRLVRALVDDAR